MLLNSLLPISFNSLNNEKMVSKQQLFYTNENISINKKIEAEQRRRNQVYQSLDYLLSTVTYFDFFSLDSFKIIKSTKKLSRFYKMEFITNDLLLLSFIYSNTQITKLLEEYGINKENILKNFNFGEKNRKISNTKFFELFEKYNSSNKKIINSTFSLELNLLIEKAAETALERFKTPVISSEILFLTLIEQKNNKLVKILKKIVGNDLNWQLLRYKLVKRIHKEESIIRDEITKNQYYFAYLLKTQLTDLEFDRLMINELLPTGVELFRNTLISKLLDINISNVLLKDIHKSIDINNKRIYS
jgi:hypothetical protein